MITQKREIIKPENQPPLEKASFMREVKEDIHGIYAGETQAFFTGPLTIRIHEADGTPYEHIVDIKDGNSKIDIPYNTKYKRLKRKNLQKQRQNAGAVVHSGENADEALYYCLGDVLQSEEEIKEWKLVGWSEDMEQRMDQESYEWIRIDADFEWLCSKEFVSMQSYMYVSQLQQDRDIVAQYESIVHLRNQSAHALVSTFLVRTLMDSRYFYGIRAMAAECLKNHIGYNANGLEKIGLDHLLKAYKELFCYPGTETPRSNDFRDKRAYKVEMAIMKSLSQVRKTDGTSVKDARERILDSLRFNDNTNNAFSDYFKIANLLSALTDSIIVTGDANNVLQDSNVEDWEFDQFKKSVIEELDRYRRMDEWINSYQNIFTVTVLDCKQRLMKANVIPVDPVEFAQYLHDGTSDFVRIKAFNALIDLGFMNINSVTSLLLNVLSTDPSPFTRDRLFSVFYLGLANFALGEVQPLDATPAPSVPAGAAEQVDDLMDGYMPPTALADGDIDMILGDGPDSAPAGNGNTNLNGGAGGDLVVENDVSLVGRKALVMRTTTIEGALAALKVELQDNKAMQEALWSAIKSRIITVHEQTDLLDICFLLYDPDETMIIKMKYPRYWAVQNLGKVHCISRIHIFWLICLGYSPFQDHRQSSD
jgi:transcription initiation factor TFIID subunit 2